jgi:hypothetical protein
MSTELTQRGRRQGRIIKKGYCEIIRGVGATVAARLLPEVRAAAAIAIAIAAYAELQQRFDHEGKRNKALLTRASPH